MNLGTNTTQILPVSIFFLFLFSQSFSFKINHFIENVSPRCMVKVISYAVTLESEHIADFKIPIIFISIGDQYSVDDIGTYFGDWKVIQPSWMGKVECVFNLIYFYPNDAIVDSGTSHSPWQFGFPCVLFSVWTQTLDRNDHKWICVGIVSQCVYLLLQNSNLQLPSCFILLQLFNRRVLWHSLIFGKQQNI